MGEKLCVVCLKRCSCAVSATLYELDGRIGNPSKPHGILPRPDRPPVYPESLGLCREHQEYYNEGLVAVIEIQTVKNQDEYDAMASQAEGRTGNLLYLPKEIVLKLAEFPSNNAVVFCEPEPFNRIKDASKNVWS